MAMVMPRSFSSGALSIWSNGVKSASPFAACTLVMAAVSVVLPWSMWPIVPMLTCGLVLSNFFFAISLVLLPGLPAPDLLPSDSGHDLARDLGRNLLVGVQLHGRVRRAALRPGPQVGGVAEQLGQRDQHADHAHPGPLVDMFDPAPAGRHVAHDVAHELLRGEDLELH